MGKPIAFSCMITTRNRVDSLRRTLQRLEKLDPRLAEILVTADGCADGTVEFLERWKVEGGKKGERRVIVNEKGVGSVASRDRMMREAKGELVLALDDDSYPEDAGCLATLDRIFQADLRLGIAVFPQRTDEFPETLEQEHFGPERPVASFACAAACLRVSTYRSLPGFESIFSHMYEEPDYALQCLGHEWGVRWFPQVTIRHHWKRRGRNEIKNHHLHARNELWSTLMRCPMPHALGVIAFRVVSQAAYAARRGPGWLVQEPVWWCQAFAAVPQALQRRKPLPWKSYFQWLLLKRLN